MAVDTSSSILLSGNEKFAYTPEELALTTPDGRVLVFDAKNGVRKTEFVPTSHLSAAATCLAWKPWSEAGKSPNKKPRKRKSSISQTNGIPEVGGNCGGTINDLLAIGTASGSILIYSTKFSEVKNTEDGAHASQVNDIVWNSSGSELFSCSSDGHIGRYVHRKSIFSKFRLSGESKKHKYFSVALHPSEDTILVGTSAKFFWVDLDTQVVLKAFGGHKGDITSLTVLLTPLSAKLPPFVISTGGNEQDHTIAIWKLDDEVKEREEKDIVLPDIMLNANEAVKAVCVGAKSDGSAPQDNAEVIIGCVSTSGFFHAFEFDPASKRKKNKAIRAKNLVKIASPKDDQGRIHPIPIIACQLTLLDNGESPSLQLVRGTHAKPVFENFELEKLNKSECFVRTRDEGEKATSSSISANGCKYVVPDSTSSVHVLGPGAAMTPKITTTTASKRKNSMSEKVDDLPMLDRLRLLSRDTEHVTTPPRAESLEKLLLQGLHNDDEQVLNQVLDRANEELIDNTVRRLPVEAVVPLIQVLQKYLKGRGAANHSKWLRSVLQHHTAFLMANPNREELLGPVYSILEARTKHHAPIVQLKGKLNFLLKQLNTRPEETSNVDANKEALLVYKDDSSDELSDVLDELLMPASDTEENWNLDDDDDDEESDEEDASDDDIEVVNGGDGGESDSDMQSD